MALVHEGLPDPGADVVALQGKKPFVGNQGDPILLGERARELGLTGATFTNEGQFDQVIAQLDTGRVVPVAGGGDPYNPELGANVLVEGTGDGEVETVGGQRRKVRTFPSGHWLVAVDYQRDPRGRVSRVVLNDPDHGHRLSMTREEFMTFFSPEGDGHIWTIQR